MEQIQEHPAEEPVVVVPIKDTLKLSKPMAGLETVLAGRTDFFAELAQVVSLEVQRLLRYTMLQYAQPRCAEAEERAEADVQNALGDILSHFGEYVDTALQIVSNASENDAISPNVEKHVLAHQLDNSISQNQQLLKRHESQEERIKRLNGLIKTMRVQYYKEVENLRDRFRNIIGRYLPDLPGNEMKNVLTDLTSVKMFEPNLYLDEDTQLAVQHKTEALQAEFQAERITLLNQIQTLTEMEAESRHRLKIERRRGERLQNNIDELVEKTGVDAPEVKVEEEEQDEKELQVLKSKSAELARLSVGLIIDTPTGGGGASQLEIPVSPSSRDVHKQITEERDEYKKALDVLYEKALSANDLLDKQYNWLDGMLKPDLNQEISVLKAALKEARIILSTIEEDPVDLEDRDELKEKQANEIKVLEKERDMMRLEIDGLKGRLETTIAKKLDIESDLQQHIADLAYANRELESERAKVEGLQAVEKPKTETLKHANTTLKILKMMKWGKAGQEGQEGEPGQGEEELTTFNPKSIDEKISELVEDEAKRFNSDYDTMKRQFERSQTKTLNLEKEKVELEQKTKEMARALEDEQGARMRVELELESQHSADERRASKDERRASKDSIDDSKDTKHGSHKSSPKKLGKRKTLRTSIENSAEKGDTETEAGEKRHRQSPREKPLVEQATEAPPQTKDNSYTPKAKATEAPPQTKDNSYTPKAKVNRLVQTRPISPQRRAETKEQDCQAGTAMHRKKTGPHDCNAELDWHLVQHGQSRHIPSHHAFEKVHDKEVQDLKDEILHLQEELMGKGGGSDLQQNSESEKSSPSKPKKGFGARATLRYSSAASHNSGPGTVCELCRRKVTSAQSMKEDWLSEGSGLGDGTIEGKVQPLFQKRRVSASSKTSLSVVLNDEVEKVELDNLFSDGINLDASTTKKSGDEKEQPKAASGGKDNNDAEEHRIVSKRSSVNSLGGFSQVGKDLQEEHRKLKNELRVEYEACLQRKVAEERGRLYRAWPRVASADLKTRKLHERLGKKKTLNLEMQNAEIEAVEFRDQALMRIDAARMLSYSRVADITDASTDARVDDLRELLESQELFSHYECIGSLTRRLMACRGEFIRMRNRLAGSLFEMDRLRLEMNLQREEFMKRNCDFAILWRRQAVYLSKCSKLLQKTGSRVAIPPVLLRDTFDASTVAEVLQTELETQGRGSGEGGKEEFEVKLEKRIQRVRYKVLTNMRHLMLGSQLKAYQMADALFVFHKIQEDEPGVKPTGGNGGFLDLKDLKDQFKDVSSLPEAVQQLKMGLRMSYRGDEEFIEKAPIVIKIMDHVEDRERKIHEDYHEAFNIDVGNEPPRRQFEDTIDLAIKANKCLDNADYDYSEAAIEAAKEPVSDSSDDEDGDAKSNPSRKGTVVSRAESEDSLRVDVADAVAASLRRAEKRMEKEDSLDLAETSSQLGDKVGMVMSSSKKGYLKEAIRMNFQMHSGSSRKLKAIVDLARAKRAVMETSSVISEVENAMNILGTQGLEAHETPRQKKAKKAASMLEQMEAAKAAEMVMKLDTEERGLTMDAMSSKSRLAMLAALPAVIAGMSVGKRKELQKNYESMTGKPMPETEEEFELQIQDAKQKLADMEAELLASIHEEDSCEGGESSEPLQPSSIAGELAAPKRASGASKRASVASKRASAEGRKRASIKSAQREDHKQVEETTTGGEMQNVEREEEEEAVPKREYGVPPVIRVERSGVAVTLPATVPHGLWETGDPIAEDGPSMGFFNDLMMWSSPLPTLPTPPLLQECSHPFVRNASRCGKFRESNANAKRKMKAKYANSESMKTIQEGIVDEVSDTSEEWGDENAEGSNALVRESLEGDDENRPPSQEEKKDDRRKALVDSVPIGGENSKLQAKDNNQTGEISQGVQAAAQNSTVDSDQNNLGAALKSPEAVEQEKVESSALNEEDTRGNRTDGTQGQNEGRRGSKTDGKQSQIEDRQENRTDGNQRQSSPEEGGSMLRKAKGLKATFRNAAHTLIAEKHDEKGETGMTLLQKARSLKATPHVDTGTQTTESMRSQKRGARQKGDVHRRPAHQPDTRKGRYQSEQGSDCDSSSENEDLEGENATIARRQPRQTKKRGSQGRTPQEEHSDDTEEDEEEDFDERATVKRSAKRARRSSQARHRDEIESEDESEESDNDDHVKDENRRLKKKSRARIASKEEDVSDDTSIDSGESEEDLPQQETQRRRISKSRNRRVNKHDYAEESTESDDEDFEETVESNHSKKRQDKHRNRRKANDDLETDVTESEDDEEKIVETGQKQRKHKKPAKNKVNVYMNSSKADDHSQEAGREEDEEEHHQVGAVKDMRHHKKPKKKKRERRKTLKSLFVDDLDEEDDDLRQKLSQLKVIERLKAKTSESSKLQSPKHSRKKTPLPGSSKSKRDHRDVEDAPSGGSSRNSRRSPRDRSDGKQKGVTELMEGVEARFRTRSSDEAERLTVQQLAEHVQKLSPNEMTELVDSIPNFPKMVKIRTYSGNSLPGSGRSSKAMSLRASPNLSDIEHEMPDLPKRHSIVELLGASDDEGVELQEETGVKLPVHNLEAKISHKCSQCDTTGHISVYCLSCGSCGTKCSKCGGDMEVGAFDPETNLWCCQGCWLKKLEDDPDHPCPFKDDAMAMAPRSGRQASMSSIRSSQMGSPPSSRSPSRSNLRVPVPLESGSLRTALEDRASSEQRRLSNKNRLNLLDVVNSGSRPNCKVETAGAMLTPNAHINEKKGIWAQVFAHLQRAGKKVEVLEFSKDLKRVRKRIRDLFSKYVEAIASEDDLYKKGHAEALEAFKAQENSLGRAVYGETLADIDISDFSLPQMQAEEDDPQVHSQLFRLGIAGAADTQTNGVRPSGKPNAAMQHYLSKGRKQILKDSWIIHGKSGEVAEMASKDSLTPRRWQKRHAVQYDSDEELAMRGWSGSDHERKAFSSILFQGQPQSESDTDADDEASGFVLDKRRHLKKMWHNMHKLMLRQMLGCFKKLQMATVLPTGPVDHMKAPRGVVRPTDKKRKKASIEKLAQASPPSRQESYVGAVSWNYRKPEVQPAAEPEPEAPIVVPRKPKEPWTQERAEGLIRALVDPRDFISDMQVGQRGQRSARHGFKPEARKLTGAVPFVTEYTTSSSTGFGKWEDAIKASKPFNDAKDGVEPKMPTSWLPVNAESDVSLPQISPSSPNKGAKKQGSLRTPRDWSKLGGLG